MLLELDKDVELKIIDLALAHIKKVETDPEVKTDGDNFDYWNSFKLEDGSYVDYNIYCGDDFCQTNDQTGDWEYTDPSEWSWSVACYGVDPPKEEGGYQQVNMDIAKFLFHYNNGKITYED